MQNFVLVCFVALIVPAKNHFPDKNPHKSTCEKISFSLNVNESLIFISDEIINLLDEKMITDDLKVAFVDLNFRYSRKSYFRSNQKEWDKKEQILKKSVKNFIEVMKMRIISFRIINRIYLSRCRKNMGNNRDIIDLLEKMGNFYESVASTFLQDDNILPQISQNTGQLSDQEQEELIRFFTTFYAVKEIQQHKNNLNNLLTQICDELCENKTVTELDDKSHDISVQENENLGKNNGFFNHLQDMDIKSPYINVLLRELSTILDLMDKTSYNIKENHIEASQNMNSLYTKFHNDNLQSSSFLPSSFNYKRSLKNLIFKNENSPIRSVLNCGEKNIIFKKFSENYIDSTYYKKIKKIDNSLIKAKKNMNSRIISRTNLLILKLSKNNTKRKKITEGEKNHIRNEEYFQKILNNISYWMFILKIEFVNSCHIFFKKVFHNAINYSKKSNELILNIEKLEVNRLPVFLVFDEQLLDLKALKTWIVDIYHENELEDMKVILQNDLKDMKNVLSALESEFERFKNDLVFILGSKEIIEPYAYSQINIIIMQTYRNTIMEKDKSLDDIEFLSKGQDDIFKQGDEFINDIKKLYYDILRFFNSVIKEKTKEEFENELEKAKSKIIHKRNKYIKRIINLEVLTQIDTCLKEEEMLLNLLSEAEENFQKEQAQKIAEFQHYGTLSTIKNLMDNIIEKSLAESLKPNDDIHSNVQIYSKDCRHKAAEPLYSDKKNSIPVDESDKCLDYIEYINTGYLDDLDYEIVAIGQKLKQYKKKCEDVQRIASENTKKIDIIKEKIENSMKDIATVIKLRQKMNQIEDELQEKQINIIKLSQKILSLKNIKEQVFELRAIDFENF